VWNPAPIEVKIVYALMASPTARRGKPLNVASPIRASAAPEGPGWAVDLEGDLTRENSFGSLDRTVAQVLDEQPEVLIVRVKDVEVIDLEGIGALLRTRRRATEAGARFFLVDGQPVVRRRLEVAGVLTLLEDRGEID
jgi:anti-anti-sigma factor